jgi:multiple sugar transport system permease protein
MAGVPRTLRDTPKTASSGTPFGGKSKPCPLTVAIPGRPGTSRRVGSGRGFFANATTSEDAQVDERTAPVSGESKPTRRTILECLDRRFVLFGILPTLLATAFLIIYPTYLVFKNGLFLDVPGRFRFVGIKQYTRMIMDPYFWGYLKHTLYYSGFTTLISFIVGMVLALCLNTRIRLQDVFRVWVLIPWAIPPVVSAIIFKWFFNDIYGAGNDLLMELGIITAPVPWLASKTFAMPILIFCDAWTRIPFVTVVILAGLQTVPQSLYEAGKIDGGTDTKLFRYITIPYIKGAILVALLVTSMFSFRVVALMLTLTGGGPGDHTKLLAGYVYENAFIHLRFGYSSALSVAMLIMISIICLAYISLLRSDVRD